MKTSSPAWGWSSSQIFLLNYRHLLHDAQFYAVRFADVRRLDLDRFPYGLFYVVRGTEVWLLAVLHASRDTEAVLAEQRRQFRG